MTPLSSIARQLGGSIVGNSILCPGPGHSSKDRSLSVMLSPSAPDGFIVFSHAGDDPLAAKDYVRQRLGWAPREFARKHAVKFNTSAKPLPQGDDEAAKIARAVAIWDEARNPIGTLVEGYLASRSLDLPWEAAGEALRFHPACPWRDEVAGKTIRVPAMVAAMRSIATGEITAVHRTRLTADGAKVDRRMLGKASGAAVMLMPYTAIGDGLAIGEGIETCLAAWALGWSNTWALGSVGAIASFPLIHLASLMLLAETGDGGASARAIETVGARYEQAGREVLIMTPRHGDDLNDALQLRCSA